jgi:HTH-type transcriptional regulator/antitoxin HipB
MNIAARTPDQLGEALRRIRKSKSMTQKDVSQRTNLRIATISSLENGDPGTQLRTVMSVMSALGLEFVIQSRDASGASNIEDIF